MTGDDVLEAASSEGIIAATAAETEHGGDCDNT
jgi:hypothetical protein